MTLDKSPFTFQGLAKLSRHSAPLVAKLCSVYATLKILGKQGVAPIFRSIGLFATGILLSISLASTKGEIDLAIPSDIGVDGLAAGVGLLITRKEPESETAFIPWGDTKGGGFTFVTRF